MLTCIENYCGWFIIGNQSSTASLAETVGPGGVWGGEESEEARRSTEERGKEVGWLQKQTAGH